MRNRTHEEKSIATTNENVGHPGADGSHDQG